MTLYKKLILTFTLAAGLSVLPNAFAAPVAKPKPTPIRQGSTIHGEDSIDVFAVDMTTAPEPKYKRPGRPPPKGKYGEDRIDVLAFKARPQPAPPSKPNTTKTPVHSEDSATVLAATAPPKQVTPPGGVRKQNIAPGGPKHSEDSATVLAWKIPPPPRRPIKHGLDSTIV